MAACDNSDIDSMQWQRWLRTGLGVFFVALVLSVVFTMRSRTPVPSTTTVKRADPNAAVELPQGADITWTQREREAFTLRFTRGLSYPDGRYTFAEPHAVIPDRNGRRLDVVAREAEVFSPAGQPRHGTFRGTVVLTSSDGLTLKTEEASFSEVDHILRIPGAFTFSRGRTTGSGRGATYDQTSDVLVVNEEAKVQVAPDPDGASAMDISASAARIDRRLHQITFERGVTAVNGTQTTSADSLVAFLTDNDENLTRVELRGGSRVTDPAAAAGTLREMRAQDINLAYAPDGRTLKRAELRTGSVLELAGAGSESRRLAAETIDADLADNGRAVQQLAANQRVQLDLPAEDEAPARRINSNALQGTGGANGLRDATFTGAVEYHETQAASGKRSAIDRTAHADRLDATLKPGLGAPEAAVFRGRARIVDGQTTAEAGVVNYAPDKNAMTLETPAGVAGATPNVADERVTIFARLIELTLDPRKLTAKGGVKSVLKDQGNKSERPESDNTRNPEAPRVQTTARRKPAILTDTEPVNVTAAELQYDAQLAKGVYTGGARLWQGETTVQGDTIEIDDETGNLAAHGQARTRMMLQQTDAKTKTIETVESIGSADDFVYDDGSRRATYTSKAHLTGPQGDVSAKKIELYLDEDGRTLDRAEAYEDVAARLQGGQQAFGARLTYFAADERYKMTGAPVKILEIVEGGCRETVGASLTFTRSTDTISVVGTEGNRSRTMPGSCAGAR